MYDMYKNNQNGILKMRLLEKNTLKKISKPILHVLILAVFLGGFPAFGEDNQTPDGWIKSHAYSTLIGKPKYPADFKHLNYVNPNAPKGGEISLAAYGSFDSMHPYSIKGRAGALSSIFFENLFSGTEDEIGTIYGLLASSLEYPPDKSAVIFNLRKEAHFSDNTPVTASDVAFSFEIFRDKGLPSYRALLTEIVESVDIITPHRIKFTFTDKAPRTAISMIAGLSIFSKASYSARDIDFTKSTLTPLTGSGPYILKEIDIGKRIIYERNLNYWGNNLPFNRGQNNFDRIRIEYFSDGLAAFEGFKSGIYSFRQETSSKSWATKYNFPALTKGWVRKETIPHNVKASNQSYIFNLRRDKFKDRRVREAIGLMFNFTWTNHTLFYDIYHRSNSFWGNSTLAAKGLPSPAERAILDKIANILPPNVLEKPPFSYPDGNVRKIDRKNLRKASALLDEAGWRIGANGMRQNAKGETLRVEFLESNKLFDRVTLPYIENLKRLGIDAVYDFVDQAQEEYRKRPPHYDYDIIVGFFSTPHFANSSVLKQIFDSKTADISAFNSAGLKSPAVDYLLKEAENITTRAESRIFISALDRVLRAENFRVPQWYLDRYNIAYYDMYEYPKELPPYGLGYLSFWWYNAEKGEKLKAMGAF